MVGKLFRFCRIKSINLFMLKPINISRRESIDSAPNVFQIIRTKTCFSVVDYCDNHILGSNFVHTGSAYFFVRLKSYKSRPSSLSLKTDDNESYGASDKQIVNKYLKDENLRKITRYLDELSSKNNYCDSDWDKLEGIVLSAGKSIKANDKNVETLVMKYICTYSNIDLTKSYLFYRRNRNKNINPVTLSLYLRTMEACWSDHKTDDENIVETICDEMLKVPLLERKVAEGLILGLCLTKRWKESLKVAKKFEEFYDITNLSYSAIIKAAFKSGEHDFGIKLFEDKMLTGFIPHQSIYVTWIEHNKDKKFALNSLLKFLSKHNEELFVDCAKQILNQILKFQTKSFGSQLQPASLTQVTNKGVCRHCKNTLKSATLNEGEFNKLRSSFLDPTLIGQNIFLKTNPEEIKEYNEFLKKTGPYDFVLDGLNIAYSGGFKNSSSDKFANLLKTVVRHFVDKNKKVLILGRKHMKTWPKISMNYVENNAHFFCIEDLSADDPFVLYAALYSGAKCNFVSRDLMRGHKYLLGVRDRELYSLFWRWQCTHQYQLVYAQRDGNVILREPVPHLQSAHFVEGKDGNGRWHVPCKLLDDAFVPGHKKFNFKSWLCLPPF